MLKLTSQHIDQIRSYFLAETNEERKGLQRNIMPYFLSSFLDDLKELFIYQPLNETRFRSIAKSMGADEHIDSLKEIQQSYYDYLASIFVKGGSNEDIEQLLKVNNLVFNEAIEYHTNLFNVFRIQERENFKKKFQSIDEKNEIHDKEIAVAFRQIERERLRASFQGAEVAEKLQKLSNYNLMPPGNRIKRNWRPIAIAASIAGFLFLAGYLFMLREEKLKNSRIAKNRENELILFGRENNIVENSRVYEVKEQRLLGFDDNEKADSLTVVVRDVKSMAGLIDFKKSFFSNELDSAGGIGPAAKIKRKVLDSLNSLQEYLLSIDNTYTYNPNRKTIILNIAFTDSVYGVYKYSISRKKHQISVNLNNLFYAIKPSSIASPLQEITDKNGLYELKRVDDWYKMVRNPLDCVNSEDEFYAYYKNMNGRLGPLAGIWKLDNYVEAWNKEKIISVDSTIDISSWVIFPISSNKYKVCDINKGYQGEKAGKDFIAFFEKVSDKFVYSCQFLYANCYVTSEV